MCSGVFFVFMVSVCFMLLFFEFDICYKEEEKV